MKLWLCAITIALMTIGCSSEPPVVTEEEFAQLELGMSREQVESIIGAQGVTGMPEIEISDLYSLTWNNADGSGVAIIFRDYKLDRAHFSDSSGETQLRIK